MDKLFAVRNSFYLGAFQSAISEASQLTGLTEAEKIERDVFVYRSYIELGTYEVGGGEGVLGLGARAERGGRGWRGARRRAAAARPQPPRRRCRPTSHSPLPLGPLRTAAGDV
jgi:hypothetical protein